MNTRKQTVINSVFIMGALVALCMVGYPQRPQTSRESLRKIERASQEEKLGKQERQAGIERLGQQQKIVRDAYVRLMRYQTAGVDEQAAMSGTATKPEDYVIFELRDLHSGPIEEIAGRTLAELVSGPVGEVLKVTAHHLQYGNGPRHAYYEVQWSDSTSAVPSNEPLTVTEVLASGGDQMADVDTYTSYEVTVRLAGKARAYRAIALHHRQTEANSKARTEIFDYITTGMNTVLADESPRVRSPWGRYIKTALYLAVEREISDKTKAGKLLIPVDAPIGYLPSDDAVPNARDAQMRLAVVCTATIDVKRDGTVITNTTQDVWVGQKINLTAEIQRGQTPPQNLRWTLPGKVIKNYAAGVSKGEVTPLTELSNLSVAFYWVDGGDNRQIQFSATVDGQTLTAKATFNVKRPSSEVRTSTGTIAIRTEENNQCWLRFGNPDRHGIDFSRTMQQGYNGTTCWVQIATTDSWYKDTNGFCWQELGQTGLDRDFPYGSDPTDQDNPGIVIDASVTKINVDDNFDMWLMYMPAGDGSIWVPLKKVRWGWQATAKKNGTGSGCSLFTVTNSTVKPISITDSTDHPEWTTVISSCCTYKRVACQ